MESSGKLHREGYSGSSRAIVDKEVINLEELKIKQCREFAKRYMKLMSFLFAIIILKRVMVDEQTNISKLAFHLLVIALFMLFLKVHSLSNLATRFVPLLVGFLSYYGHTKFLMITKNI